MKASNNEDGRRANKIAAKTQWQAKSEVSTKKVRFCMYHLQGVCKYTDETCAFAHSTEEITASRRGKRAGQAGPAQPPPARGHAAPGHLGAPPPPESLGKRRGVGAQQPAMSDPMKVGARGRRQDLAWLPASEWPTPYIEQVQFPDARGQIAMDMLQAGRYASGEGPRVLIAVLRKGAGHCKVTSPGGALQKAWAALCWSRARGLSPALR
ncbi:unnamed protein product [Prorocentrum cordatum]|uniref:C3H1-type domain-containing protein n=1 Tax=Prorocentrum cordatum TaxID=2364126 RepID=A0ABN9Y0P1_9DINO|nr:unnamed protein product [Polarella glacialis]